MHMKLITAAIATLTLGFALSASALNYTPTFLPNNPIVQASNPTDAEVLAAWQAALGDPTATIGSLLYKWTPSTGAEEGNTGLFSSSMTTGLQNLQSVDLNYTGGAPAPTLTAIYVKDGRAGWTLWDARTWNSTFSDILVDNQGLWNNANNMADISHVAVFGVRESTSVPDGSSALMLLSVSLIGLETLRRKLA